MSEPPNGITWMMGELHKREFEQPKSDLVAFAAAQAEYTAAVLAIRRACKRPRTYQERMSDPDAS